MKKSWLMVMDIMAPVEKVRQTGLVRTVDAIGRKAERLAKSYQAKLNDGRSLEDCVKQKKHFLSVVAQPWNQIRELRYDILKKIENAEVYDGL